MRTVLLERAQRDRQHRARPGRLHLGPGGAGELHGAQARAGERKRTGVGTGIGVPSPSDLGVPERRTAAGRPSAASAVSPWPCTHSGSGPSSGRPVKNLAAMQPPWQASKEPHEAQAPALCGSRSEVNSVGVAPHGGEAARVAHVAGQELAVDDERAGVDVADRVDQAHDPAGAAQVEPVERLAERGEVEERVAGQHAGALEQPVVERALLLGRRVQRVPGVDAPRPRAAAGSGAAGRRTSRRWPPARRARSTFWRVTTTLILNGPKPAAARLSMAGAGGGERALAAHGVVGGGVGAVDADLHVDVVEGGQLPGPLRREPGPVGGELDADLALDRVVDQVEEVGPDHRLAAADVDVEDLQVVQLVDDCRGPRPS